MITVVVGKEIERIKGEFESVINGMNMVGEIPYNVYSELFDVGTDYIQKAYELGKSELEAQIEKMQEKLKADLIANLKERIQYSTSPSCTKGMELFIKSIEKWEIKEK